MPPTLLAPLQHACLTTSLGLLPLSSLWQDRTADSIVMEIARGGEWRVMRRREYLGVDENNILLPHARLLTYDQLPYYYTFPAQLRTWRRRAAPHFADKCVSRVVHVVPGSNRFFLRQVTLAPWLAPQLAAPSPPACPPAVFRASR